MSSGFSAVIAHCTLQIERNSARGIATIIPLSTFHFSLFTFHIKEGGWYPPLQTYCLIITASNHCAFVTRLLISSSIMFINSSAP